VENFITLVGTSNLWPDLNPADVYKQINKKKIINALHNANIKLEIGQLLAFQF